MINTRQVTEDLVALVATETTRPCGNGQIPDGDSIRPYSVVYPMPSGQPEGSLEDDEDMRDLMYQITCVGTGPEEAAWMADKVMGARPRMRTITQVVYATYEQIGGVVREDGVTFVRNDTLRVKVSSR